MADGNVALLIDADNARPAGLDPVLTALAELGTVNIRRAYGNWRKPALKGWVDQLHRFGIEPQQQFDLTKGKNATDMKLTIDAMDLLYRGRLDGLGIMSSDSDFMPLAMRVRQDGIPVYGFGSAKTPEGFQGACTRFIDVDALVDAGREQGGADRKAAAKKAIDPDVIELLGNAWKTAKRDDNGFALLGEVGQIAGNRSSFDVRNYGYTRLSDMIADIPNFVTERAEGGPLRVKRLR
ncbi:NYN domain-containing protein [Sphingopyxis indica]|uniref:OST-HTH/LOTUS domain-containing protein n=1 Tax=Sphingopyxis indica TaxID=436663 RepID=A0A239EHE0_9SPHN|nr:NYN domain-containing protein [Sphingopyxis indica]SNS44160.1 OST-HTH/LOTUS domain-containing protein [Sphingopyxis indica]